MARYNALEETFSSVKVLGKTAMFSDLRIDRDTVPKGLYLYEIRHDDECLGEPVQIAKSILVNHFGTIIMRGELKLPPNGYLDIDPNEDFSFINDNCQTLKEYMDKYTPKRRAEKNKEIER